ncbi:hypothetical protein WICPIJ_006343 [Wickerhamomyces pijperi]|uniref:Uncharacterized protein n=1 Tax=Wickerhamomyces pijperi TaxID=599730 RepID=A0A9P8Q3V9_WICPI|nr:hypothetical protein WICPIJ_006343 [Wickerhamomyces pijperi]
MQFRRTEPNRFVDPEKRMLPGSSRLSVHLDRRVPGLWMVCCDQRQQSGFTSTVVPLHVPFRAVLDLPGEIGDNRGATIGHRDVLELQQRGQISCGVWMWRFESLDDLLNRLTLSFGGRVCVVVVPVMGPVSYLLQHRAQFFASSLVYNPCFIDKGQMCDPFGNLILVSQPQHDMRVWWQIFQNTADQLACLRVQPKEWIINNQQFRFFN